MQGRAETTQMGILSTAILAFSMSTDAFAGSIGKGAALRKPRLSEAFRTGAIFGAINTMYSAVASRSRALHAGFRSCWTHLLGAR